MIVISIYRLLREPLEKKTIVSQI